MRHDRDPPRADFAPILASAEALGQAFAGTAARHDATGEFPFATFDALFDAGLLGLVTPVREGGIGAGLIEAVAVVRAVARGEPSTALVLAMHYCQHFAVANAGIWTPDLAGRVWAANREGVALLNAAQVERGVGSPSHGGLPETLARREGEEWVLTGRKLYTTGIPILRWAVVNARTDEAEPRLGHFLVPANAPGVRVETSWNATGMRATNSHDLVLEDVRLPLADAFDLEPASRGVRRDPRMGVWYFLLIAAVYDGAARAARDWLVDFAGRTVPGALGAPLASLPRFQDGVGRIELLLATSRRLLNSVAEDFERGRDVFLDAAAAKHAATDNAIAVTDLALELGGNPGIDRSNPLERHHRDALSARAHAPQNNLIRTMLSRPALDAAAGGLAPSERRLP